MAARTSTLVCMTLSVPSLAALPWMCDCQADPEHCSPRGGEIQELCGLMVDLAQEVGFDLELPAGTPGSMLAVDPKAAHLIGDFCNFMPGVTCLDNKVWGIFWRSMGLNGVFPKTLSKLPSLTQLDLSGNRLQGSIPKLDFPNLTDLYLRNNSLSGGFPEVRLPNVWRMDLRYNELTGTLPHGLRENIPQLRRFWLNDNRFEGRIPSDIPFFNNSNADTRWGSIECGLSGNAWSCPIEDYVKTGSGYSCEPVECVPADLVV